MNLFTKAAVGAAAVLVVALVALRLLPASNVGPGSPTAAPTPTATPLITPIPAATVGRTQKPAVVPPAGPLSVGRHELNLEGIPMTFELATAGWISNGEFGFEKPPTRDPAGAAFIVWGDDADGIFSDPCNQVRAPEAGPTAADMVAAIATVPGVEVVTAPTAMTVDGRPAQKVVIRFPDELPCPPDEFYIWYDTTIDGNARYPTVEGLTIRVWIIEVEGKRVQLDGESYAGAGPEVDAELDAIVESIRFE